MSKDTKNIYIYRNEKIPQVITRFYLSTHFPPTFEVVLTRFESLISPCLGGRGLDPALHLLTTSLGYNLTLCFDALAHQIEPLDHVFTIKERNPIPLLNLALLRIILERSVLPDFFSLTVLQVSLP